MYLVDVYRGGPEVVGLLVEVPHTNLTEVTVVVFLRLVSIRRLSIGVSERLASMLVRWL